MHVCRRPSSSRPPGGDQAHTANRDRRGLKVCRFSRAMASRRRSRRGRGLRQLPRSRPCKRPAGGPRRPRSPQCFNVSAHDLGTLVTARNHSRTCRQHARPRRKDRAVGHPDLPTQLASEGARQHCQLAPWNGWPIAWRNSAWSSLITNRTRESPWVSAIGTVLDRSTCSRRRPP